MEIYQINHLCHNRIDEFRNVFKFHAYSVNKRVFLKTAKLAGGLPDLATTNMQIEYQQ